MPKIFDLKVITPERLFYSGKAELVIVKTISGDEGFMANHSWACKLLQPGELRIKESGASKSEYKIAALSEGYISVEGDVTIFTDAAEWPQEIDLERAQRAKRRAEDRLKQNDSDHFRAEVALHRAINRIKVKHEGKNK
jgi:F-type H+-transporting ATPase subunit epsilon